MLVCSCDAVPFKFCYVPSSNVSSGNEHFWVALVGVRAFNGRDGLHMMTDHLGQEELVHWLVLSACLSGNTTCVFCESLPC